VDARATANGHRASPSHEVITVDDNDHDWETSAESDSTARNQHNPSAEDDEIDFLRPSTHNGVQRARRLSVDEDVQAGPSTTAVSRALADATSHEVMEINDSDDDPPPSRQTQTRTTTPTRTIVPNVAKMREYYEMQVRPQAERMGLARPSVKGGMKAKPVCGFGCVGQYCFNFDTRCRNCDLRSFLSAIRRLRHLTSLLSLLLLPAFVRLRLLPALV
jgi:hypothetical protein